MPAKRWLIVLTITVFVVIVVGLVLAFNRPNPGLEKITLLGVEYQTNVEIKEFVNRPYVMIPINSDVENTFVEVENKVDNVKIRQLIDGLDTFVPGEYVVQLEHYDLHFIVDGMAD